MHAFKRTASFREGVQNPTGLAHAATVGNQGQKCWEKNDLFIYYIFTWKGLSRNDD